MKQGTASSAFLLFALLVLNLGCATDSPCPVRSNVSSISPVKLTDANGVQTYGIVPPSYNPELPSPWVLFNHGSGQSGLEISTNPDDSCLVNALVEAGYVVIASDYQNRTCWGNAQCVTDIATVQDLWKDHLNLRPAPYVISESMGGIVTWNAIAHGALSPLAVVGLFPACSLSNMFAGGTGPFYSDIQTAYDFSSPSGYAAATDGYDPMLAPASEFTAFPILMWASYLDGTVVRSQNEDPFAARVNAAGGTAIILRSRGGHGDVSNFYPQAVLRFFHAHGGQPVKPGVELTAPLPESIRESQ